MNAVLANVEVPEKKFAQASVRALKQSKVQTSEFKTLVHLLRSHEHELFCYFQISMGRLNKTFSLHIFFAVVRKNRHSMQTNHRL